MASSVRVVGIRKDGGNHSNPHEGITHYKWINSAGKSDIATRDGMVKWIEGGDSAYVEDNRGNRAYCGVRTSGAGNKFIQTYSDGNYNNNLLSLPPV